MKVSKGRGIKFFKLPFFQNHSKYTSEIMGASRKHVSKALSDIGRVFNKKKK